MVIGQDGLGLGKVLTYNLLGPWFKAPTLTRMELGLALIYLQEFLDMKIINNLLSIKKEIASLVYFLLNKI